MTRASFGARTVKGAAIPGWRLGSINHGQLAIRPTRMQPINTPANPPGGQEEGALRGRSSRAALRQRLSSRRLSISASADLNHSDDPGSVGSLPDCKLESHSHESDGPPAGWTFPGC